MSDYVMLPDQSSLVIFNDVHDVNKKVEVSTHFPKTRASTSCNYQNSMFWSALLDCAFPHNQSLLAVFNNVHDVIKRVVLADDGQKQNCGQTMACIDLCEIM